MISQPTVFVLGAGASLEAGFPLGSELAKQIAEEVHLPQNPRSQYEHDKHELMKIVANDLGIDPNLVVHAGRQIKDGIILSHSIDDYLHLHSHDKTVVRYGKSAIVRCILRAESTSKIKIINHGQNINISDLSDTWYSKLFKIMGKDCPKSDRSKIFENVTFINFNYDRSLRIYLEYATSALYNIDISEARLIVDKANILHPYGSLGFLRSIGNDQIVNYGDKFEYTGKLSILRAANQINTYTEQVENKDLVEKIHTSVSSARRIFFLGFGFHRQNVELLKSGKSKLDTKCFGTALGISDSDLDVIRSYFYGFTEKQEVNSYFQNAIVFRKDLKCSEIIDEYSRTIMS
jgi:hypothetical protein